MIGSRPETSLARLKRAAKRDFDERTPSSRSGVENALFDRAIDIKKPFEEKIRRLKARA